MNANLKLWVPAVMMAAVLSACGSIGKDKPDARPAPAPQAPAAAPAANAPAEPQTLKVDSIDSAKEVAYKCDTNGKPEALTVMYGVKSNEIVAAQVRYKNELTPNLFRVPAITSQNAFWGGNVGWIAEKATVANVDKVNGGMLTLRGTTQVNGTAQVVDQIVTKGCVLDKAATARLNKAAAGKAKKK